MQLRELGPPPEVLPPGSDANVHYEFHSGAPGHSVENCKALKYKVQDLIHSKAIKFVPNGPNVNNNPMPPHNKENVNMVELDDGMKLTLSANPVAPMIITVPTPFPYDNTKAVPWVYHTSVYIHGHRSQEELMRFYDPIISIAETRGVTRSGRIFSPAPPPIGTKNPLTLDEGKKIDDTQQRQDPVPANEVEEFL
ncbi:hypothetical protein KIW84_011293 [Lathyrus oleraceus]|uniref:Uncharacterized protein n=1 Tax=Pisum sativum TaxID=3888 RepID=A0A9D4YN20_PEA|nr:hypothetical protein KIW84_011293 [Pisum sativum]